MPLRHAEQHQHQLPHATAEVKRQANTTTTPKPMLRTVTMASPASCIRDCGDHSGAGWVFGGAKRWSWLSLYRSTSHP